MSNNEIAFATYEQQPEITDDDQLVQRELESLGVGVTGIPWSAVNTDWKRFNLVVLRSCWDYFHRHTDFLNWLAKLEEENIQVWNPGSVIRGNYDKTYLRELQQMGLTIVPTVYAPQGIETSINEVLSQQSWQRAVIKPTISGTSLHTWVTSRENINDDQVRLNKLTTNRAMMIQTYLPEIETAGEWSLIFIDGAYSHSVRKVPRAGDFRVQHDFGGSWFADTPNDDLRSAAENILNTAGLEVLYARVDGVVQNGVFMLMELEVIEPVLFFAASPLAAEKFAQGLIKRLKNAVDRERAKSQ
jgi:glutathione synthase/RimK-type ligase-like ATP-grasp enzyme